MIRLNRFLAAAGLGSRRKVEELISSGEVKLNGKPEFIEIAIEGGKTRMLSGNPDDFDM